MVQGSYTKLAQAAADHYLRHRVPLPLPSPLPANLAIQRACYVFLYENPGRRPLGAVGDVLPRSPNLAAEIISHTIAVVEASPKKLRKIDLPSLQLNVLVLEPLQRISDLTQLNPLQYGLYLRSDQNHRAVILPGRPGIETADDQVATAIREAGIDLHQETINLYRFGVQLY